MRVNVWKTIPRTRLEQLLVVLDKISDSNNHPCLSDAKQIDLLNWNPSRSTGICIVDDDDEIKAYAQLTNETSGSSLEIAIQPSSEESLIRGLVISTALDIVDRYPLIYWISQVTPLQDNDTLGFGFRHDSELVQMRITLPVTLGSFDPTKPSTSDLVLRSFQPGVDEDRWIELNNLAFLNHREQGAWTRQSLEERKEMPWFDPAGFLIAEIDGNMVGSCWTKLHGQKVGEIYVICVDPRFQAKGLGRSLLIAGLEYISSTGATTGMLYTSTDNSSAINLYTSIGFHIDHRDRSYVLETPTKRPIP